MPPVQLRDFTGGVVATTPSDKLAPTMSPRAINTAYRAVPAGGMMLSRRPGYALLATLSAAASSSSICGMNRYRYDDGSSRAQYRIGITTDGLVWSLEGGGAAITVESGGDEFTNAYLTQDVYDFDEANNKLFFANGAENGFVYRLSGAATLFCRKIGLSAPSAPTKNTDGVGNATGTFDFALTWYDANTGLESSRSSSLEGQSLSSRSITLNRNNTSPPARATHWRVYVRRQESGPDYWLASSIAISGGVGEPTPTYVYNLTLAQFNVLGTRAPTTTENNRPPSGTHSLCWHQSRMFYTDGANLWYSKLGQPEQVDAQAFEYVNPRDGERITALHSLSENTLAVFKETSIFLVVGDSPQNWEIRATGASLGSITPRVVMGDGLMAFWSTEGPAVWDGSGEPLLLANATVEYFKRRGTLTINTLNGEYHIAFDPVEHRFLFSVPTSTTDAIYTVLPWNTQLKCWEALAWDLPSVRSFAVMESIYGDYRIYFGASADKSAWELSATYHTDGAYNTTGANLYFENATFTNTTTITLPVAKATFDVRKNTVSSKVYIVDLTRNTVHRTAYSASGTSTTVLTLTTAMSATPTSGIVLVDVPVMEWNSYKTPYSNTKLSLATGEMGVAASGDCRVLAGIYLDHETTPARVFDFVFNQSQTAESGTDGSELSGASDFASRRIQKAAYQFRWKLIWWYPETKYHISYLDTDMQSRDDGWGS